MARPAEYYPREIELASAIYRTLKQGRGALVQGLPEDGETTLVDGRFDLREVARSVLLEMASKAQ